MLNNVRPDGNPYLEHCKAHIDYFANTGLRTLVMSYRELDEREVEQWQQQNLQSVLTPSSRYRRKPVRILLATEHTKPRKKRAATTPAAASSWYTILPASFLGYSVPGS